MSNRSELQKGGCRNLTVMDYLRAEEMAERSVDHSTLLDQRTPVATQAADDLATLHCMTPRHIVSKWVKKLRHKKKKKKTPDAERSFSNHEETLTSLGAVEMEPVPHQESGVSGRQEEITAFKLGAGLGLALVVAASKSELDKMKELRKQMEMIVEDAKEELRCKRDSPCTSFKQTCENPSCSTTNIDESINSNERVSDPNCVGSSSSPYVDLQGKEPPYIELDDQGWRNRECGEESCVLSGMAQLESELEAELQLLELQLDSADKFRDNKDALQESSDGDCETLDNDEEVNHANDPIDNFTEAHCGSVPPQELERRLHELLEAQQLERIKELEAALRRTKQKLRKKEVEVCWWKDTAHLISKHVSKTAPQKFTPLKDQTRKNFR